MNPTTKIRIANVAYLNAAPYRVLQELDWVEYSEVPPAECARMLHENEADAALIPIAEMFAHGGYFMLPFGIAARGPVESVHLFSTCPVEELQTIYIDSASYSSVMLLRLLLSELSAKTARPIQFHRMAVQDALPLVKDRCGVLVIGDISLELRGSFPYTLDLAEAWHRNTGLPFVFAVWAFAPERISEEQRKDLCRTLDRGVSQRSLFARAWAEDRNSSREEAERYVNNCIFYPLDSTLLEGADEFLRRAIRLNMFADSGIVAPASPVRAVAASLTHGALITEKSAPANGNRQHPPQAPEARYCGKRTVDRILSDASEGKRISLSEGLELAVRASLGDLSLAADLRRRQLHRSPGVSYIVDRNINYTNVCNVYCRFCAFYRAPEKNGKKSKKSAGSYLLSKEEIGKKIEETVAAGGIQILLQGGLNPELGIEYYEDLFRWIKERYPINLHALSADEILHIARVSQLTLPEVFRRLIDAGLGSLPGGGAEILVDRVRQRIARLKSPTKDWLEVHRVAHRMGLSSTCTMMFGVQETWSDRLLHMAKLRQLQDETGGFTAFITWPFQDDNVNLERGDTSAPEYLRVQSIARLFLDNIENIQSSWVTMGPSVGQTALFFGANDFGSTMFEENVVSAAGTTFCMDSAFIERHIKEAGFYPWRRTVHYQQA
jgi:cyclic dehypoxanthinyl futalosine synthase